MKKTFLFFFTILLTLSIFNKISPKAYSEDYSEYALELDFFNNDSLPLNFRKTSDLSKFKDSNLDLVGLSTLNISGSSEFTDLSLVAIKNNLNTPFPITIIDLRAEPHSFINGNAVSWTIPEKEMDEDISLKQVTHIENYLLNSVELNKSIVLSSIKNNQKTTLVPTLTETEETLTKNKQINYFRIPVLDSKRPTDEMVDRFIYFLRDLQDDNWLHFHCEMGDGRTTTFMSMYDMIKNSNNIEFINILKRQATLGGIDLSRYEEKDNRLIFLKNFYQYTRDNNDNFKTSWSQWVKDNNIKPYPEND